MNLNPGGEAPSMRDTWFINYMGNFVFQSMNFPNLPHILAIHHGKPKGLKVILPECEL
ncbi:hypothetical protein L873DRAFT_1814958 [Choiromyces venosus 120613-1]|uniref:Uncharacterized protein n=1 Tax=Choiromyces venosus 120613-1 TaxID=1336337 RepID=A0A3N4JC84_9PEZI|nr:hypothetical protein L873DRAFT_1814958 [Choiromyces venosus 120613-1]